MSTRSVIGREIINGKVVSLVDGHRPQFFVGIDTSKTVSPGRGDVYLAYDTNKEYVCFTTGTWTYVPKYQVGLDASKIATPVVGDIFKASDTLRQYVCFVAGAWTFVPGYYVGLDASKPVSPIAGEGYNAVDTGKTYTCFVSGVWSLTNSPTVEDYSNHLGIVDNMMSVSTTDNATAITDNITHSMQLSSGITTPGSASYISNRNVYPAIENFELNYKINNIVLGSGGSLSYIIGLVGYHCAANFQQTDAGTWKTYTDAGSGTIENNIANIVSGDRLTIKNYGIIVMFFVNGILVATHLTTPFTSGLSGTFQVMISGSGAVVVARLCDVNFISWRVL